MSVNREHICWQRADGTWAIGFWAFSTTGEDFEWDVNYYDDEFWWFSEGHASNEAALDAYRRQNANPGHLSSLPYSPEHDKEIARYEEIAKKFKKSRGTRYIRIR